MPIQFAHWWEGAYLSIRRGSDQWPLPDSALAAAGGQGDGIKPIQYFFQHKYLHVLNASQERSQGVNAFHQICEKKKKHIPCPFSYAGVRPS